MTPEQIQALDRGHRMLSELRKMTLKGAEEMCKSGHIDHSADLYQMNALLTEAYGIARRMKDGDGNPMVRSGEK